jgi:hypothetical protein
MDRLNTFFAGDMAKMEAFLHLYSGRFPLKSKCPPGIIAIEAVKALLLVDALEDAARDEVKKHTEEWAASKGPAVATLTSTSTQGLDDADLTLNMSNSTPGNTQNPEIVVEDDNKSGNARPAFCKSADVTKGDDSANDTVFSSQPPASAAESSQDKRPICKSTRLGMVCMVDDCNKRHFPPCMVRAHYATRPEECRDFWHPKPVRATPRLTPPTSSAASGNRAGGKGPSPPLVKGKARSSAIYKNNSKDKRPKVHPGQRVKPMVLENTALKLRIKENENADLQRRLLAQKKATSDLRRQQQPPATFSSLFKQPPPSSLMGNPTPDLVAMIAMLQDDQKRAEERILAEQQCFKDRLAKMAAACLAPGT